LIDENLIKYLKKKYPPIEYKEGKDHQAFLNEAIFRSGQRDVVNVIEHLMNLQKGDKNG